MRCDERSNLKGSASFSSPKIIGFYSVGPEENYLDNCSQLRYLNRKPPEQVKFDLNHNIDSWTRISCDGKLKFILSFFKNHRETFDIFDDSQIALDDVPFMCCRALLRDFRSQPYLKKDSIKFTVCLFRGILFMHYLDPEQYMALDRNSSEWTKTAKKWGIKFEQYLLSSDPSREPDISSPIESSAHFYCVFERRLELHRLIFAAEMDGMLVEYSSLQQGLTPDTVSSATVLEQLQDCEFIEIKSRRVRSEAWHHLVFKKHHLLNWWNQSHLTGIKSIFCGSTNDNGIVKEIVEHEVENLPSLDGIPWKPQVCFNVCNNMLTFIKHTFSQKLKQTSSNRGDNVRMVPLMQLVFERKRGSDLLQISERQETDSILDDWFIQMFADDYYYEDY